MEVWQSNVFEAFRQIREVVKHYPYVSMDTEFPGVVARPIGDFNTTSDYQYQLIRCNVDLLKLIQIGLTFMNGKGECAPERCTWQFNFRYDINKDMYAEDSIQLLRNCGINFERHQIEGIDPSWFAEMLITSGIVLMSHVNWITFHSGYDFCYLLKILTNTKLPEDENEFFELLKLYFPTVFDIKYLMKSCKALQGGLQDIADQMQIKRIGRQHQAGSDSLLTGSCFYFSYKELVLQKFIFIPIIMESGFVASTCYFLRPKAINILYKTKTGNFIAQVDSISECQPNFRGSPQPSGYCV
jgi:CCR4-NOT transcription complex subunit 7/8